MSYSPEMDKSLVWQRIRGDPMILEYLELTGQKLIDKANAFIVSQQKMGISITLLQACDLIVTQTIIKRSKYDDLNGSQKRITIYFRPSRQGRNISLSNEVLQVDCHVPLTQDYIADRIIGRVVDILKDFKVNGRPLKCDGHLGELNSAPGFYCCGCRFNYYTPY